MQNEPTFQMTRFVQWLRQVISPNRVWDGPVHWARSYFPEGQQNLAATVASILVEQLGVGLNSLYPTARFIEDLGVDGLDAVELVMALEEEFEFSIPDDCERLMTVGELVQYLSRRVEETGGEERTSQIKKAKRTSSRIKGLVLLLFLSLIIYLLLWKKP